MFSQWRNVLKGKVSKGFEIVRLELVAHWSQLSRCQTSARGVGSVLIEADLTPRGGLLGRARTRYLLPLRKLSLRVKGGAHA